MFPYLFRMSHYSLVTARDRRNLSHCYHYHHHHHKSARMILSSLSSSWGCIHHAPRIFSCISVLLPFHRSKCSLLNIHLYPVAGISQPFSSHRMNQSICCCYCCHCRCCYCFCYLYSCCCYQRVQRGHRVPT